MVAGLSLLGCQTWKQPESSGKADGILIEKRLISTSSEQVVVEYLITPNRKTWVSLRDEATQRAKPGLTWFEGQDPVRLLLTVQQWEAVGEEVMGEIIYRQEGAGAGVETSRAGRYLFPLDSEIDLEDQVIFYEFPLGGELDRPYIICRANDLVLQLEFTEGFSPVPSEPKTEGD